MALRICGVILYALIAIVAIWPDLAADLDLGLDPQEVEAVLLGLVIVVGVNLAWFGVTERSEE